MNVTAGHFVVKGPVVDYRDLRQPAATAGQASRLIRLAGRAQLG